MKYLNNILKKQTLIQNDKYNYLYQKIIKNKCINNYKYRLNNIINIKNYLQKNKFKIICN